jgi:hypothetical protein
MEPVDKKIDEEEDASPRDPADPRIEWEKENIEIEGRMPDMEEAEEDTSEL